MMLKDVVCVLDMFSSVKHPPKFLRELKRKTGKDGPLIIDDGHQRRSVTKKKILNAGLWIINREIWNRLKCRPS